MYQGGDHPGGFARSGGAYQEGQDTQGKDLIDDPSGLVGIARDVGIKIVLLGFGFGHVVKIDTFWNAMQGEYGQVKYFSIFFLTSNGARCKVVTVPKKTKGKQGRLEMEAEKIQVIFHLPPALHRAIKREARNRGMTRSGVVVQALMRLASIRGYAIEEAR